MLKEGQNLKMNLVEIIKIPGAGQEQVHFLSTFHAVLILCSVINIIVICHENMEHVVQHNSVTLFVESATTYLQ